MTTVATEVPEAKRLENGRIVAIAGPVIDVEFPPHALPEINTALQVSLVVDGEEVLITAEVAQQIGEGRVRCICLKPTDGLARGAPSSPTPGAASPCPSATRCSATSST